MFGFKKKGRAKAERMHKAIKEILAPHFAKAGERLKLRQRIRLANIRAIQHPKKMMLYYCIFAVFLLVSTTVIDIIRSRKETTRDVLGLSSVPSMTHRLQSLNNTEIQNERIRQEINSLGLKGMEIYSELDSLMNLPVKTHNDSVRIINNYNILKNTFNDHGNKL